MSSYNYSARDRAHSSSRPYSSDHPPQRPPPSNRASALNLNNLLNSDEQPMSHTSSHYSPPPLASHAAPYTQPTLSFSYNSQANNTHYGHNHNDYPPSTLSTPSTLSHSLQPSILSIQRHLPTYNNTSWGYSEPSAHQLPGTQYKVDHGNHVPQQTLSFIHNSNVNQNSLHRIHESTGVVPHETLRPLSMSINQLLSRDPNEDTSFQFTKSQNGPGGVFDGSPYGRSNLSHAPTDSTEDKESAITASDPNTDASLHGSDRSEGESTEEEGLKIIPPPRKIPEPEMGFAVLPQSNRKLPATSSSQTLKISPGVRTKRVTSPKQRPQSNQKPQNKVSKTKKSSRIDAAGIDTQELSHSSESSGATAVSSKAGYGTSQSSESTGSEESDSDGTIEEKYSEELINYMVEVYQRQKRVVDEYERRCKMKKETLRRKFLSRINIRIPPHRTSDKENEMGSVKSRSRHKKEKPKPSVELPTETDGDSDISRLGRQPLKNQKHRDAIEVEERRKIWKDIVRNAIPRMNKIVVQTTTSRANNCRKVAQLCQKEARKAAGKSCKSAKDIQSRVKQANKQMLMFWKRNEKEERELRKKAEREALERMRVEEELREAKRQARKLNFLITQTELYSHFVGKKIGTQTTNEVSENSNQTDVVANDQITESSAADLNMDMDMDAESEVPVPPSFADIDFDEDSEDALREKARIIAQNALKQVKKHTADFDGERTSSGSNEISVTNQDLDQMNFQNPSSMPSMAEIKQPSILVKVTLKDYQLRGLNWLANLYEQGINGILADEMILPYWGTMKDRAILRKSLNKRNLIFNQDAPFHVVITSYQLIVQDQGYFSRTKWQYMILDEAQAIKSSTSARWKTLLGFQCRNRLLLTGTPIQNSMQELWALLHFIMPTLFDSHQEFSEWFSKDIESHAENKGSLNEHQLKRLHMILKPFMLRRVKKNVQNELGDKIEKEVFCQLTARQRVLYRGLRDKISVTELLEKAATWPDNDNVDSLMNLVMQFRKVCNHPELFDRADVSAPFAFCYYSSTFIISREEHLYLPYTTKNVLTYKIPKTIFRSGGFLNIPGNNSNAGSRSNVFNHLMNIWRPDYINKSLWDEQNDTFAFLKFVDLSPSEASEIFFSNILQRWLFHLLRRVHKARRRFFITQDGESYSTVPINTYARFLIAETAFKLAPMNIEESSALNDLTNIFENTTRHELVVLDLCYMPKAISPPIQPICIDKGFYNDQEQLMFNPFIRSALSGIKELMPQNERNSSIVSQFLVQSDGEGVIGQTYRKDNGLSYMRVPPLKKLVLDSGKLTKLDELLKELKAGGHRVLIYFQMTRMIDLMEEYLAYRQYKYLRLDGSSKIADRRDMVEDWQTRSEIFVFLLSTRAGGLGINLTAADTVIFYDSDWNPTVDQQAMDRAHRLGQTKQVTVYRLITKGTIEERILQRAKQKDEIQKVVISGGEFKQVDFKPREIVSLLLEDDELEAKLRDQQSKRKVDDDDTKKKGNGGKRRKKDSNSGSSSSVISSRTLEDLWHEGEPPMAETEGSGVTTPTSSVGGTKKKRTTKTTSKAPAKTRAKKTTTNPRTPRTRSKSSDPGQ
ncbi:30323_t:CDS:10 [Gigaspora margarita]|uniref:Chromatin-remodeling ATPase INO80 n=1 Tax=Gigaspora margarita TaxID=4874 RepID=A0ABM8W198_GIGMA|nr:30323_t:CDS:10 [Gigaspora margarita]